MASAKEGSMTADSGSAEDSMTGTSASPPTGQGVTIGGPVDWARVKRRQAKDADLVAAYASGIGEHGISNACYRLAGILRRQARELSEQ